MEIRTDRVGLLIEQLTESAMFSRDRLDGIADEEFLWEPTQPMWSIRKRSEAKTPAAFGPGEFVMDFDPAGDPFAPGTLSTIAWRVGHLVSGFAGRYEWTFGSRSVDPKLVVEFSTSADVMMGRLWDEIDRWVAAVGELSDEQLNQVGFGQYPQGLDPQLPFIGIVRWVNREAIHHLAEVALLRDLYRTRT